jgi:signal transduction histidine kinase
MEEKSLTLDIQICTNFISKANYFLSESLVINLLGNAVKHSLPGGKIVVELTNEFLRITNYGEPLKVPAEKLFGRFYKVNMASDSPGLGLSIVSKICEIYNWSLIYSAENSLHTVTVTF